MRGLIFVCALGMLAGCSKAPNLAELGGVQFSNPGIRGGYPVSGEEAIAQSTVALYLDVSLEERDLAAANYCSGTLIAPKVVLTAAHCFVDAADQSGVDVGTWSSLSRVGFGIDVVNSFSDTAVSFSKIDHVVIHPFYVKDSVANATRTPMYDAALVFLSEAAPRSMKPAKLAMDKKNLSKGTEITLAGFGLLARAPDVGAVQLMKVNVHVDNPAVTSAQFTYLVEGGKSACSGDSGGPAYLTDSNGDLMVVGVTSWGDIMCSHVGAYTSVPAIAKWITSQL